MLTYSDFLNNRVNEQNYYDYNQDRKFKEPVQFNNQDSPLNQAILRIGALQNEEIRKIQIKFNKMKAEVMEDSIPATVEYIRRKLLGKTLWYIIYTNVSYNNYKYVIDEVVDVKCELDKTQQNPPREDYVYSNPRIIVSLTMKSGEQIRLSYNGGVVNREIRVGKIFIIESLINHLKKNIGRDLSFTGAKVDDVKSYMKKKPRIKTIKKNLLDFTRVHVTKIKSVHIETFPKIGDLIVINDEYIFMIDRRFELTLRRIGIHDPYGEENWADEDDSTESENRWWDD